ncbi:MAG: hypothetical protein R3336_02155, partial [Phycisphaeraceae bacterium]|nr:hypothetical protein [Phycisphaeraceae bacterium]
MSTPLIMTGPGGDYVKRTYAQGHELVSTWGRPLPDDALEADTASQATDQPQRGLLRRLLDLAGPSGSTAPRRPVADGALERPHVRLAARRLTA